MGNPFRLTKWYFDCLESDGRAAIGYWATCSWHGIHLTWHELTVYPAEGPQYQRSSRRFVPPPAIHDGALLWTSDRIGCSVRCEVRCGAFESRLLENENGALDWRCEAPAGKSEISYRDGSALHGTGYAERLTLGIAPWRLPLTELLWGRWISADLASSLVWIRWRGRHPLTLVLVNGRSAPGAEVGARAVVAGRATLRLGQSHRLRGHTPRGIAGSIGRLSGLLPPSILALRQTRWRSWGELERADGSRSAGWAVHEQVRLP